MEKTQNFKKPRIGTKVYCIYKNDILVETVEFLGKDSFIIGSFGPYTFADSWEWYYNDYEFEWFTNLAKAKKELQVRCEEEYGEKIKIKKMSDTWYQAEFY